MNLRHTWLACCLCVGAVACGDDSPDDGDGSSGTGDTSSGSSAGTTDQQGSGSTSGGASTGTTGLETGSEDETESSDSSATRSESSGAAENSAETETEDTGTAGSDAETTSGETSADAESSSGEETGIVDDVVCRPFEISVESFFPEGISADAAGNVYVGSLGAQQIVRQLGCSRGDEIPQETFVDDPTLTSVVGILVDDVGGVLWACNSDNETFTNATIRGYGLGDGELVVEHPFGADGETGFCNDLALDDERNLYATDSASGRIMRVAVADLMTESSVAEPWASSEMFEPEGQYSLNGLAFDGEGALYSVMSEGGRLFRFDLSSEAPASFVEIDLDRGIEGGDGLEWLGGGRLLVNENAEDRLSVIEVAEDDTATVTVVIDDLIDQPTTSVLVRDTLFIVQSQLDALRAGEPGTLPFRIVTRPWP